MMSQSEKREAVRQKLADDVTAFLLDGGVIEEVDHTANKTWRDREKPKRQGNKARHNEENERSYAMRLQDARGPMKNGPDHAWRTPAGAGAAIGRTI